MEIPISVSREDLYKQVWTTPMRRLAKEYGLSDVGLAKVCKSLEIPRPPVGYWAKIEAGKAPPRPPLPKNTDPDRQGATITPTPEPKAVNPDPTCEYDADLKKLAQTVKAMSPIKVPQSLRDPHHLVRLTERCFQEATPDSQNLLTPRRNESNPPLSVRVSKSSIKRTMRFYDALIKAVERLGGKVVVEGKQWHEETVIYLANEQTATIRVRERYRQNRKAKKDRYDWNTYEYVPIGILVVELGRTYERSDTIEDTTKAPIEDRINSLLLTLVHAAHRHRKRRREDEEARRRKAEWERKREVKLKLIEAEEARIRELLSESDAWHQSNRIRQFVSAAHERAIMKGNEAPAEHTKWSDWALKQADRIDPLVESPPSIIDEKKKYERRYEW